MDKKTIATLVIVGVIILAVIMLSPQISPISSIRDSDGDGRADASDAFPQDPSETDDSDGDGTGDNSDAFPTDPAEWKDSDGDEVGDNADYYDEGKGSVYVRVTRFAAAPFVDCGDACDFKFYIGVDYEGTSKAECVFDLDDTWGDDVVEDPQHVFLKCNVPDAVPSIDVTIYVLDFDGHEPGGEFIWDKMDYTPDNELGKGYYTITVSSPFSENFSYVGNGDSGHKGELSWLIEVGPE